MSSSRKKRGPRTPLRKNNRLWWRSQSGKRLQENARREITIAPLTAHVASFLRGSGGSKVGESVDFTGAMHEPIGFHYIDPTNRKMGWVDREYSERIKKFIKSLCAKGENPDNYVFGLEIEHLTGPQGTVLNVRPVFKRKGEDRFRPLERGDIRPVKRR